MDEETKLPVSDPIEPIEHMLDRLGTEVAFGEPTAVGDVTLIPVAEVSAGFGYAFGYNIGKPDEETARPEDTAGGAGGGGGGMGRTRPRGYIRVAPDGVQFEPFFDPLRISLAGIAMGAWTVYWVTLTIRALARSARKSGR